MTRQDDHAETHTPTFKAKVAVAAVKGEKTLTELTQQLTCIRIRSRPGRLSFWTGLRGVFETEAWSQAVAPTIDVKTLHAKR